MSFRDPKLGSPPASKRAAASAWAGKDEPAERMPAGTLATGPGNDDGDGFDDFDAGTSDAAKRPVPSVMGFGRRREQEAVPVDIPELLDGVKVDVYVR